VACLVTAEGVPNAQEDRSPVRVLLLHQYGANRVFRPGFDAAFVEALRNVRGLTFDLYTETIETERFPGPDQARLAADFLREKYAGRRTDVIVAVGDDALVFARSNRAAFGNPPLVALTPLLGQLKGEDNITGLQGALSYGGTVDLAQTLFPETSRVVIVDGIRENPGDIEKEVRRQLSERRRSFEVEYLSGLPLSDLLKRVKQLPANSIVFVIRQTMRDRDQDMDTVQSLEDIAQAANAPVFHMNELGLGRGIVGGDMWRFETDARRLAALAGRVALGTPPRDVPPQFVTAAPMLDWRQLQRWRVPESRIPDGATVLFRPPASPGVNRPLVIAGFVVFGVQLALIVGLLLERMWRRRAESETQRTRDELAHLARVASMGEMAASLAHELHQPLGAIMNNAQVAVDLASAGVESREELKEILQDIVDDDRRAGEIIGRVRELVTKRVSQRTRVSMSDILQSVAGLMAREAGARQISLEGADASDPLLVSGDRVQLQQVALNLLRNALDATATGAAAAPRVWVSTALSGAHLVHVVVGDNGPGLVAGAERRLFEAFYTTKTGGMGMGLSIARSIVESHGGKIWAVNGTDGGAEFHFTIPRIGVPASARRSEAGATAG
jgi:signal transduction histidine kinase